MNDYAAICRQTYGESEAVAELIPFMLVGFLEGDRAFAKARKEGLPRAGVPAKTGRQSALTSDNT
ncbi:DUF2274 domain-containing protein [Mesorhizobium sp.]|uniref:DUF2274 domain-containing protein n=1 Tax=Mesorhizobium sp. TaxID=1871066 RepID=UPI000FE5E379|nr:DUF2274 domain-containing protein [Mesorhizobium sp.]RWI23940.1 MAG: DUF2274 domain-containing protein [Mesorhizobium sp.]RWK51539.1 MAG: DUF2274 domain-containing protein [Mesorhizobium sp.]RWK96155.1 MAG: DUF2274 domain-containing protein [Mesorhizobium sp.]TIP58278.1 MAG: DUF2274 domain-containing protein [Mesorhizobium sp.]TIQ32672.1 MAG: DUF2274 domain-containing protein [Mesorhizobium sp.]